ncbi:MAG: NAD kinase [Candidatus Omnitrophica bacterium]|nr:NAD kinase [Candidatus Omnitrophota bacterium]
MPIRTALLVYKQSAYESYFGRYRSRRVSRLAEGGDRQLGRIRRSHDRHYGSLEAVERALRLSGVRTRRLLRGRAFDERDYDLIVSVGGDGTFLEAARQVRSRLVIGVNSDTSHSVGRFCYCDADGFAGILDRILKGSAPAREIWRLILRLDGRTVLSPVLNDVLVGHAVPAAMSHYVITLGGVRERQRSSGVWISTAAGSTGACRSAGGRVRAVHQRQVQYVPRELFEGHGKRYRLRGGEVKGDLSGLVIESQMEEGRLYVDGAHRSVPFRFGSRLTIRRDPRPLRVVHA